MLNGPSGVMTLIMIIRRARSLGLADGHMTCKAVSLLGTIYDTDMILYDTDMIQFIDTDITPITPPTLRSQTTNCLR